jgi:hypothetical protein
MEPAVHAEHSGPLAQVWQFGMSLQGKHNVSAELKREITRPGIQHIPSNTDSAYWTVIAITALTDDRAWDSIHGG